jgi:hypothetical protein
VLLALQADRAGPVSSVLDREGRLVKDHGFMGAQVDAATPDAVIRALLWADPLRAARGPCRDPAARPSPGVDRPCPCVLP